MELGPLKGSAICADSGRVGDYSVSRFPQLHILLKDTAAHFVSELTTRCHHALTPTTVESRGPWWRHRPSPFSVRHRSSVSAGCTLSPQAIRLQRRLTPRKTRSQAVARVTDRTASQQTI